MNTSSILEKVKSPITRSYSRTAYYVNVDFVIDKSDVAISMKIDTGSAYTIVGLDNKQIREFRSMLLKNGKQAHPAYDASSREIDLYAYTVEDFYLTKDIVFPKFQIYFSKNLGEKALIGMDTLSLFNFRYMLESNSTNGVFEILDYQKTLDRLFHTKFYKEFGYIMPEMVLSLDGTAQKIV